MMYNSLTNIPLSPFDDEQSVCASELYTDIHFEKVEMPDVDNWESKESSCVASECEPLINKEDAEQSTPCLKDNTKQSTPCRKDTAKQSTPCRKDNSKLSNQCPPTFIFGECGSGKTTWCKHLVKCWLQTSDNNDISMQDLNLPDIRNIQILLFLPMKYSDKDLSFVELLKKYIFKENSRYLEFVMNFVKDNAQNVLIIMDGMDITKESSKQISRLLHDNFVSSCTVIVTSRPSSLKLLYDSCQDKKERMIFYKIREMDIEDSEMYARRLLGRINDLHGKNLVFENFWDFAEHLQVKSLLKVPYRCLLIMYVWTKYKNSFIEITDILLEIVHQYIRRALSDHQRKEFIEKSLVRNYMDVQKCITKLNKWSLLIEYSHLLCVLSRVAAAMFTSEIKDRNNTETKLVKVFSIEDDDRLDIETVRETGLLTESMSHSENKDAFNFIFSDRIMCEFFVSIFIALQEGKECDFIAVSVSSLFQNSMIVHMLSQLSNTVAKCIMKKARMSIETKCADARSSDGNSYSNNRFTNTKTEEKSIIITNSKKDSWLQCLMYREELHQNKLLFLTTALHFVDSLTSLALENPENKAELVFWLPFITTVETLRLKINGCTLLLCKEWYDRTHYTLKEVVIQSVYISITTFELLIRSLRTCEKLEKLKISPAVCVTENNFFPQTADLAHFSWMQLSQIIADHKKLKYLKLSNLSLVGEVDIVVSHLNYYANLEVLELKNLSNVVQKGTSALHLPDYPRFNDNESELPDKINLKVLSLEELTLLHSPINFMLRKTKKGETNICKNNLQILRMLEVVMPSKSWEKLGNQLGLLKKLFAVYLQNVCPSDSAQIILDGIGKCEELKHLSVISLDTRESSPYFTFLKNLKVLSKLQIENMNFSGSSALPLFEGIRECKKLESLSFCNISIGIIPENVSFDLQYLSELTVDTVNITEKSDSLYMLLDAFKSCKNLKTMSLNNVRPEDVPPVFANRKTLKINMINVQNNV